MLKLILNRIVQFFLLICSLSFAASAWANLPYTPIQFPRDDAAHYKNVPYPVNTMTEWWYYNGDLVTTDGKKFGYYLSYFYVQLMIHGQPFYIPQFILQLTDVTDQKVYGGGVFTASDKSHYATDQLNVVLGDVASLKKIALTYYLTGKLKTKQGAEVKIAFSLTGLKAPLMVGNETGLVNLWDGANSYYYSVTNMMTAGSFEVDGKHYDINPFRSVSWMDHQWGDFIIAPWNQWFWTSVQLNNGIAINFGVVMDEKTGEPKSSSASIIMPDNSRIYIKGAKLTPYRNAGEKYPNHYALNIPDIDLSLSINNLAQGQDSNSMWEGISDVSGFYKGKPVSGYAYAENTIRYKN